MHSHGPRRRVARRPASSSTKTLSIPLSTKNTSSTSWVCGALPWPGGTNMTERVKPRAGMTLGSSCLPEPPAPIKRCWARRRPSILASSKASQSGTLSRKRPIWRSISSAGDSPFSSGGISWRAAGISGLRSEAEIYPGLDDVEILADRDPDRAGPGRPAIGHGGAADLGRIRAEIEIVVFEKARPARRKRVFEAGPGSPAPFRRRMRGEFEPGRKKALERIALVRPGGAGAAVEQPRIGGVAEPPGDRAEPVDVGMVGLQRRALKHRVRMVAAEARPGQFDLRPEDEPARLEVVAGLAAAEDAAGIVRADIAGAVVEPARMPPAAAEMRPDMEAGPIPLFRLRRCRKRDQRGDDPPNPRHGEATSAGVPCAAPAAPPGPGRAAWRSAAPRAAAHCCAAGSTPIRRRPSGSSAGSASGCG